jgi:hypothetical protein
MMLDAHPEMAIPPETHFIPAAVIQCVTSSDPREAFIKAVSSFHTWPSFRIGPEFLKARLEDPFDLGEALRTFYRVYAEMDGKCRWGDKTPAYSDLMALIRRFLPEARFIHLLRDGRDVALSHKGLWFGPGSVAEAGAWWASKIKAAREQVSCLPHYLEIRYEDLVSRPEPILREVCDFIELNWNPVMLEYHKTAQERLRETLPVLAQDGKKMISSEERKGIHRLTSKPPQSDRIGRWRKEMNDADREAFEKAAGWTLRELGYEVSDGECRHENQQAQTQLHWLEFIERLELAMRELAALIPSGQSFILVDDNQWGVEGDVIGRYSIPFLECNGQYWGPPENDETAIRELNRLAQRRPTAIVFAWPAFWWLDYYKGFRNYLRSSFPCLLQNERLVIFDLRK